MAGTRRTVVARATLALLFLLPLGATAATVSADAGAADGTVHAARSWHTVNAARSWH